MDTDQEERKRLAVAVERFQKTAFYWATEDPAFLVSMMMEAPYWLYRGQGRNVNGAEVCMMLCLVRQESVPEAFTAMLDGMPEPVRSILSLAIVEWMKREAVRVLEEMSPEQRQSAMEGAENAADMAVAAVMAKVSTTRQQ